MKCDSDLTYFAISMIVTLSLLATVSNAICTNFNVYAFDSCDASSTCKNLDREGGNSQTNNCSNFSRCLNEVEGSQNTQINECDAARGPCLNDALGDTNSQNIDCSLVGDGGCRNSEHETNSGLPLSNNIQNIECKSISKGCLNSGEGNRNKQYLSCVHSSECTNFSFTPTDAIANDNTQNLNCILVTGECLNIAQGDRNNQDLICMRTSQCGNVMDSPSGDNTQESICANSGDCLNDGLNTNIISNGASECKSNGPDTTTYCQPGRIITRPNS